MLSRTRVSGAMDMSRLGAAVSHPGIDPRKWNILAYALADSMISEEGHFVDVVLTDGREMTCQVGAFYEGPGFGIYAKIHKDDELEIEFPDGDPGHGGVVVTKLYSAADPPPDDALNNPDDFVLVIEKDKSLRMSVQGSGQLILASDGGNIVLKTNSQVMIGADGLQTIPSPGTDGVVTGQGIDTLTGLTYAALQNASQTVFAKK